MIFSLALRRGGQFANDSLLEETGFEPLVPLGEGTGLSPAAGRADRRPP